MFYSQAKFILTLKAVFIQLHRFVILLKNLIELLSK